MRLSFVNTNTSYCMSTYFSAHCVLFLLPSVLWIRSLFQLLSYKSNFEYKLNIQQRAEAGDDEVKHHLNESAASSDPVDELEEVKKLLL